jgi:hypothetical protein
MDFIGPARDTISRSTLYVNLMWARLTEGAAAGAPTM